METLRSRERIFTSNRKSKMEMHSGKLWKPCKVQDYDFGAGSTLPFVPFAYCVFTASPMSMCLMMVTGDVGGCGTVY